MDQITAASKCLEKWGREIKHPQLMQSNTSCACDDKLNTNHFLHLFYIVMSLNCCHKLLVHNIQKFSNRFQIINK